MLKPHDLINLQNIDSNFQKYQLVRNCFRLNINKSHFDQLQQILGQTQELLNSSDLGLKNHLRGGGCLVCKCQNTNIKYQYPSHSHSQYITQVNEPKKILEVKEIKKKLIEHFNQNSQFKQFISAVTNCDDDCVIFTYQTISIYLEMLQKQEFLKIEKNQLFPIYESIQQISQDTEWKKIMFQFYFDLLQQANEFGTKSNDQIYGLLSDFSKQEQYTQNQWDQLKKQKDKFSSYETFYFYQAYLNKLIQPNNFGISLDTFANDFINNQDQKKQINSYQLLIAAQLNLMYIFNLTKQNQQLNNFIKTVYEVKQIITKDDEYFVNSIIKQQDKGYEEIQIWLSYHFLILEHTSILNKSIQDHITQFFEILKIYKDKDFLEQLNCMKNRLDQKNNQLQVINPLVNIVNDGFKQQLNYKDQLDIVREKKKDQKYQQKQYYITPQINITTSTSKLESTFDEEVIKNLFEAQEEDIYWLFGKFKSGKTDLTKKIIDYLWKNSDQIPIYFDLTDIEQNKEKPAEFLKTSLKSEPFNLTDQQIQDCLNANEKFVIFLDYFDQMSLGFRNSNIINMLGYKDKKINQKLVIITREQVQDLPSYQPLIQRMIRIELKEFDEGQKRKYIQYIMNKEIQSNQININVQQMISINFNDVQILIQEDHVRQIKMQLTQENQQSIQKMVQNMLQLNSMMKDLFVSCFSFHYQFKLLLKLITQKNSEKSPQRFQEYNKSKNLVAQYQEQQKKQFKQLLDSNSNSSSDTNSPSSKNEEPIGINKILDSILTKSNQKYRPQQEDIQKKQILNPQLTKFEYFNSLVDQYIQDSFEARECICSTYKITKKKVREFQSNLALLIQQKGNNDQESQNELIKIFCLLKSDGEKEIFIDEKFKDFFIANFVLSKINQFTIDKSIEELGQFNNLNLCQNAYAEAVALLSDQLLLISEIKNVLIQLIKLSKNQTKYIRCSSNSMYLLSILKLNLEGEDLSQIQISEIPISGLSFYYANLCNSHWENVDLSYCNFNSANLTGAKLESIKGILQTQTDRQIQIKQKEESKIIGVLDQKKNIQSKESQHKKNQLDSFDYHSIQANESQVENSSKKNHSIQNDLYSNISIKEDNTNKIIYQKCFKQHCSSFCFLALKDQVVCALSKDRIKYKINFLFYKKQNEIEPIEIEHQFDKITKMATYKNDQILVLLINNNKILLIWLKRNQDHSYKLDIENKTEINADNFTISNCKMFLAAHNCNEVKIYDQKLIEVYKFSSVNDWWRQIQYKSKQVIFEKPQPINIFDSQVENAQYSPDGQNVVIQFKSKTEFYSIKNDAAVLEMEKVNNLIFSKNYFATSSNQGIKIYSFPECELLDWLPFKAKLLIFSYKQEQKLAIISDCNFILDLKDLEQTSPKIIRNFNQQIQDSPLIIAVSTNKTYKTMAQNGLIHFIDDQFQNEKKQQYQDETILSMGFFKDNIHLAVRSKKNNQHIFRMINFSTQKTTLEWKEDNQTEDTEFSNQFQYLLIEQRIYVISNQNNRLVFQDVTQWCLDQRQNENNERDKPPIILELTHQNNEILLDKSQKQTMNMAQLNSDMPDEQFFCFNFSISQDQTYIAACFSQKKNQFKKNGSTIIIWKYIDKSPHDYKFEFDFSHDAGVNLYFLEYENLLLLIFKFNEQQCIQLVSIQNKNKTSLCLKTSDQPIQSIAFSSQQQQFFAIHSNKSFSLYEIINEQIELKYYFKETEIPIYFSQTGTHVIYAFQQSIIIRNVDGILERIKNFYLNGIKQQIDQNEGICFSDNITYLNHENQMIYQYSQDQCQKISLGHSFISINCSQFSQDENILIIISAKERDKQFLRILFKTENNYSQQQKESDFDQVVYSCKFLTISSFILILKDILIYEISDFATSVKQLISLPNFFYEPQQSIETINVHPNRKDFLAITKSGQIQIYKLTQDKEYKYKLYKTLPRNLQAKDCVISKLNASDSIIEQLKYLGAIYDEKDNCN
ncbi:unnamed protein product (macronuclear) [Paramecium tetraurelia]|uniref:Uncharacterized protein n=1 Tax=Paramecium tetraurelia TaxID=5888 RepID=A0BWS3_PARTE|nr:uncharacterized protein GSPATT00032842001 [Paramecium tetraurelia]CAK62990.1 unnamed protein product [Paramecium tetraurelia]|eukprot:XP_001430388.1 hypothetical protein (macronuclear) [Paramecium tetraurelia strain d4-2]